MGDLLWLRSILLLFLWYSSSGSASRPANANNARGANNAAASSDMKYLLDTVRYLLAEIHQLRNSMVEQEENLNFKLKEELESFKEEIKTDVQKLLSLRTGVDANRNQQQQQLTASVIENDDDVFHRFSDIAQQLTSQAEEKFQLLRIELESNLDEKVRSGLETSNEQYRNQTQETFRLMEAAVKDNVRETIRLELDKTELRSRSVIEERFKSLETTLMGVVEERTQLETRDIPLLTPINLARTCRELMHFNPNLDSGVYYVDPDGWHTGDPPIQVHCEKSGDTIVAHDSMNKTNVGHCFEAGCYSRRINYRATFRQLRALTRLSSTCSQSIRYDCYATALTYWDDHYAWWNDVKGTPQYYWAGNSNSSSSHTCSCGQLGACIDARLKCNCDASVAAPLFDEGLITNRDHLPVTRLNFGRLLSSSSKGEHTLGPLRCSGASYKNDKKPTSCADLWLSGRLYTGLYHVQQENGTVVTLHCDMSKLPDEAGFETFIGINDLKTSLIHFSVARTSGYSCCGIIRYNYVTLNLDDAMNITNGVFTAPRAGIYSFSFNYLNAENNGFLWVHIRRNGSVVAGSISRNGGLNGASAYVIITLAVGDQVDTYLGGGSIHSDGSKYINFSGSLLVEL